MMKLIFPEFQFDEEIFQTSEIDFFELGKNTQFNFQLKSKLKVIRCKM